MKKQIKNGISWAKFLAFFATKQKRLKVCTTSKKKLPAKYFSRRKYFKFQLRVGLRLKAQAKLESLGRKTNRKGNIDFENVVTMRKTLLLTSVQRAMDMKISNQKK